MKVLLLTCNTGMGHNSAAKAIEETLREAGVACDTLDFLKLISDKAASFICNWHTRIYRHAPKAFATGYSLAEAYSGLLSRQGGAYGSLARGVSRLHLHLQNGRYDVVVCAHTFAAMMMTRLRNRYGVDAATYFVATDYTCSPPAGETDLDGYFIPHPGLMEEFVACGLPRHKLIATGIPVRPAFYERVEKRTAKALLGLPSDKRNVLLMCGSMGCGPIEELTERLADLLPADTVLSVICGTNEKLRHSLAKANRENVLTFGYTKEIPLFMDSAELFLTKPGGISISEAAAKRLPMVLIDAVGGCEKYNLAYFTGHGWAKTADTPASIARCCADLLGSPTELASCAARLEDLGEGKAAERILAHLLVAPAQAEYPLQMARGSGN